MKRRSLPIGIQTFREIREGDYYYVDKTGFALRLIDEGKYYFLSRPRRFGKSLFLDTLAELFAGNEALFRGLEAERRWDWSRHYPIIRMSFAEGVLSNRAELDEKIAELLAENEKRLGVRGPQPSLSGRFHGLISATRECFDQRVVVLVDEYDKPILDNITDPETARAMRDGLRNLYSVIKGQDAHIRFAFLTGVSKFSKVSLFSGLNNVKDITVDERYSALCGYTEADLDRVFAPELDGLDRDRIRAWYNGYNWTGEAVYNPYDVLLLFDARQFRPWWFETATPTFLIQMLTQRGYFTPDLARRQTSLALLSSFDVEYIDSDALLFQTGYLTIHEVEEPLLGHWVYTLGYPNREVETSLNAALLPGLGVDAQRAFSQRMALLKRLQAVDFSGIQTLIAALFAAIPHQWHDGNPIARYEGYYASVFYSHLAALGLDLVPEDASHHGRLDLRLRFNGRIWLFEFKVVELAPEGRALQQIKDRGYAEKYRAEGLPIHLIGIEFSRERRALVGFEVETL